MRLGYACMNVTLQSKMRTCRLATVEKEGMEKVKELTLHNLSQVLSILKWNVENDEGTEKLSFLKCKRIEF